MEDAIKNLIKTLTNNNDELPHFSTQGYTPVRLSKNNFYNIQKFVSNKKTAFIDGGNQEIIGAHNFSLQLIRVYYCVYQLNKKIISEYYETYALINANKKENSLEYSVKFFFKDKKLDIDSMTFDAYDSTLSIGARIVKVESIGDTVRKFLEISLAKKLCEKIPDGFIIMDTTLEATVNGEKKIFDELYKEAKKNNVIVSALSKTTNLLTENGNSVIAILNSLKPGEEWYYHPLVEIDSPSHNAEIYLVKLNKKSKYVFRLEIIKEQKNKINELLSILADNSTDPVFLGYPYGLIDADKNARITNRETDVKRTQLFIKLGKDFDKLKNYLNTKNAHNILDNIL